jgi:hypothetical protein
MKNAEKARTYGAKYRKSKVNFFGKRGRTRHDGQMPSLPACKSDSSVGRPYFPSNGHHRHLNFLGRTSWERKDKLLVNQR